MNNLVINGGCESDQVNVGALLTLTNTGTAKSICDSFQAQYGSANGGVVKAQRIADGPPGVGSCIEFTCTTAASSVANSDYVTLDTLFTKAQDMQGLAFGTAGAFQSGLGFYIKASFTGVLAVAFRNAAFNRTCVNIITTSAGAWTYVALPTIPSDTSASWNSTGNWGSISIVIVSGSNYQTGNPNINTWIAGSAVSVVAQNNSFLTTVGASVRVTGLFLGVGADTFTNGSLYERNPLNGLMCNKRVHKSYEAEVAPGTVTFAGADTEGYLSSYVRFPIEMDVAPNVDIYSPHDGASGHAYDIINNVNVVATAVNVSKTGFNIQCSLNTALYEHVARIF